MLSAAATNVPPTVAFIIKRGLLADDFDIPYPLLMLPLFNAVKLKSVSEDLLLSVERDE